MSEDGELSAFRKIPTFRIRSRVARVSCLRYMETRVGGKFRRGDHKDQLDFRDIFLKETTSLRIHTRARATHRDGVAMKMTTCGRFSRYH